MYIAQKLKKENIAEYLLYMWQTEDLIRACHLNADELKKNYTDRFQVSDEQKRAIEQWYEQLIRMMREEGVQEKGHLQINKNVILTLTDLHLRLLRSEKFPDYTAAYYKALPRIVDIRNRGDHKDLSELENCFDALYGVMMLRLQKKPLSEGTQQAANDIARLLRLLSAYYHQEQEGALNID